MIRFANKSIIDLDVIRIMGVSVKEGDNPIGYFGTGLKFAIATLLRTGHKVSLVRDGKQYVFGVEDQEIRGEEFGVVTMGDERLPFTTELGRNWTPEMAYRELHSNCLDEGGEITDGPLGFHPGTLFEIEGDGIRKAYLERANMFLEGDPIHVTHDVEIHEGSCPSGFYRGVRAINHEFPSLFRWNVTADLGLTEDRTVRNPYAYRSYIRNTIASMHNVNLLERILLAPKDTLEGKLDYSLCSFPSQAFLDVCARFRTDLRLNQTAYKLWIKSAPPDELEEAQTSDMVEQDIAEAMNLLRVLGCAITRDDFKVVESLGDGVFGVVRSGQIMIAMKTLNRGTRFIASTLYEEWCHKELGLHDETRSFQDHLLDNLMRFVAEYQHAREENA